MSTLHNDLITFQQEQISLDYRRMQRLREEDGKSLVYPNQAIAAQEIHTHFINGKQWVVLVAQPGMGKTGAQLETVRLQCMRIDNAPMLDDVMVCTGMSDTDWERTMRNGLLPCFRDRVFHRGRLPDSKTLKQMKHGLIVADECHIACAATNVLGKTLHDAELLNIKNLIERDMRMLDVSATPEAVSEQIRSWGDKAAVVILQPGPIYKGFQSMLDDNCLCDASSFDMKKPEDALKLLRIWDKRYTGRSKRWFPCRIYSPEAREAITHACSLLGWAQPKIHDSVVRIEDIDGEMEILPTKHTVILIKHFWRASKRLIRTNVGGTFETKPAKMDTTATSQGLAARFCDNFTWSGEQEDVNLRPLHFTDVNAVKEYLNWYTKGCVYGKVNYTASRMKSDGKGNVSAPKSKVHPTNIVGLEGIEEEVVVKLPYGLSPTFDSDIAAKAWCKRHLSYSSSAFHLHDAAGCGIKGCKGCGSRTHIHYRTFQPIYTEEYVRSASDIGQWTDTQARRMPVDITWGVDGIGGRARRMPVLGKGSIGYIVVFKKDKLRRSNAFDFFSPR